MANGKRGPSVTPMSQTDQLFARRTAETLSETDKAFRDAFVNAYIIDFSGTRAMFRVGHTNAKTAASRASQLLRETYVLNRLDEIVRKVQPEDVVSRGQVMSRMWQEANNDRNLCGTRVTALAHIAKMLGMMNTRDENSAAAPVGVMMIPVTHVDDWSRMAGVAQAALKAQAAMHSTPPA